MSRKTLPGLTVAYIQVDEAAARFIRSPFGSRRMAAQCVPGFLRINADFLPGATEDTSPPLSQPKRPSAAHQNTVATNKGNHA
jgi:hypothetical protein